MAESGESPSSNPFDIQFRFQNELAQLSDLHTVRLTKMADAILAEALYGKEHKDFIAHLAGIGEQAYVAMFLHRRRIMATFRRFSSCMLDALPRGVSDKARQIIETPDIAEARAWLAEEALTHPSFGKHLSIIVPSIDIRTLVQAEQMEDPFDGQGLLRTHTGVHSRSPLLEAFDVRLFDAAKDSASTPLEQDRYNLAYVATPSAKSLIAYMIFHDGLQALPVA